MEKKEKSETRKAKREAKKAAELAASKEMPVVDPAAYRYAADDDPDNLTIIRNLTPTGRKMCLGIFNLSQQRLWSWLKES